MATNIAPGVGNPYTLLTPVTPDLNSQGFVENVGIGVKVFVSAYFAAAKFYGRYRTNIVQAAALLDTISPPTTPPRSVRLIQALDAVFALAGDVKRLDAPGAG